MALHTPGKQHKPLPAQAKQPPAQEVPAQAEQPPAPKLETMTVEHVVQNVTLTITLAEPAPAHSHRERRADIHLGPGHADVMKRLRNQLERTQARLRSGQYVRSTATAALWLIEQVETAAK